MPTPIGPQQSPADSFEHRSGGRSKIATLPHGAMASVDRRRLGLPGPLVHCGLFVLTFFSVTLSQVPLDADENYVDLATMAFVCPARLTPALPFAVVLMAILLAHEMGHYLTARYFGVKQSLPYFIPAPTLFGTLGAVITLESLPPCRRSLLWIAVMGPLAGLGVALPAMAWGMAHPSPAPSEALLGLHFGNSWLLVWMSKWFGLSDQQVLLHPVALAGWAGLFFTSLNLIPASQLDGGHMAYALFGQKQRLLSVAVALVLLVFGLDCLLLQQLGRWSQSGAMWIVWGIMLCVLGHGHPPVADEALPLRYRDKIVAWAGFILFAVTFVPAPIQPR